MKKQWGHTIQLKKALLLMGFFCLVTLFSSFAVINDETRFQIELIIQHQFNQVLAVSEYNVQIEEDLEGNKVVTVSPENATDVFGICYLDYTSNVYGLNKIYLHAYPLYRVDNLGEPVVEDRVGYQLDFSNQTDGWSHTLEISTSVSGMDMIIPISVPFVFENGEIKTLSRSIGVTAVFTDFANMSGGTYSGIIQIGLEAL